MPKYFEKFSLNFPSQNFFDCLKLFVEFRRLPHRTFLPNKYYLVDSLGGEFSIMFKLDLASKEEKRG